MKIEQVMAGYRAGLPIRRRKWPPNDYLVKMLVRRNGKEGWQLGATPGMYRF